MVPGASLHWNRPRSLGWMSSSCITARIGKSNGLFHAAHLSDIRISACLFVSGDGFDLPFPQKSTLGVDFFRSQNVALVRGLPKHCPGPGEKCHVPNLNRLVRDFPLWRLLGLGRFGSGTRASYTECCSPHSHSQGS